MRQRGSASLGHLSLLVVVALAASAGFARLGGAMHSDLAGGGQSTGGAPSSVAVSRQAGTDIMLRVADAVTPLAEAETAARSVLAANKFMTGRHFFAQPDYIRLNEQGYEKILGPRFVRRLLGLGPERRWLDAGSGDALAVMEFLEALPKAQRPKVSAVAYAMSEGFNAERAAQLATELTVHHGRFIEHIPAHELGATDLISDVFGPLSYTDNFGAVLRRYGEILRPNGEVFAFIKGSRLGWEGAPRDGLATAFFNALKTRVQGLEVMTLKPHNGERSYPGVVRFRRTGDELVVPDMRLVNLSTKGRGLPDRAFGWAHPMH